MNETFEQFCDRMSKVEKKEELIVGRASSGNTRSTFNFEGYGCCLESYGYRRIPDVETRHTGITLGEMMFVATAQPHDVWVLAPWVKGKKAATKLAKQYGGQACPDEYHEDDLDAWYLRFPEDDEGNGFKNLMRIIWDHKQGNLPDAFPWGVAAY